MNIVGFALFLILSIVGPLYIIFAIGRFHDTKKYLENPKAKASKLLNWITIVGGLMGLTCMATVGGFDDISMLVPYYIISSLLFGFGTRWVFSTYLK